MIEPLRLKDKYRGALEARLIGSARTDRASSVARRRALVAVGAASSLAALPATTTAAAGAKAFGLVGAAAAAKWAGVGLVVGVLTIGGVQAPRFFAGSSKPAAIARSSMPLSGTRAEARTSEGSPFVSVPDVPVAEPIAAVPTAAPAARASNPARAIVERPTQPIELPHGGEPPREPAPAAGGPELRLASEIALLDEARRSATMNPLRSLALLDEYARRFPLGDLAPEALVLRIEALARTGERDAAEDLARDYLAKNPSSPHAERIRTLLGWDGEKR